ncbi:alpha/beta fold hydrolase [Streptomyces paromomycinus]|uniref:alpha/beta fold hydrolase n=1 Tax=Streptomyces paromomycinus TaxID=92743 RepID=UPI003F4CCA7E
MTPDVDLNTHITDVLRMIEAAELTGVTLVGHSYGGMVAAGVTARLRHPAVRRLIYLDSPVPVRSEDVAWVPRRSSPHPYATVTTPLHLPGGWNDRVERWTRCAPPRKSSRDEVTAAAGRHRMRTSTSMLPRAAVRACGCAVRRARR